MNILSKSIRLFVVIFLLLSSLVFPETYYVKPDGDDATSGTSWQTAFKTITKAVNTTINGDNIWVAEGTYQEGDTITIPEGISVYGGFSGTETSLEERNISEHPSVIDGIGEHSHRCVYNTGTIDGFYITKAIFRSAPVGGAGIYNENGIVSNCTLYSNSAYNGGGIYNYHGLVTHCTLYSNSAFYLGGGICNYGTVTDCTIYSNSAGDSGYSNDSMGGGIYNLSGNVNKCELYSNSAHCGGGIYNDYGIVTNCPIYFNTAKRYGGGIYNDYGTIINCLIYANSADISSGGIYNGYGTVTNSTIYSNSSFWGGGICNFTGIVSNSIVHFNNSTSNGGGIYNDYDGTIYNCIISSNTNWGIYNKDGSVYNCTLYNNKGGIHVNTGGMVNCISWQNGETDIEGGTVSYSCFKEATGTNGNINADPMFINVDGNVSSWIYQVKNGSPCIDAGNPDESYNDGCQPPGKGGLRNDMGAYGGPYNCNWGVNIGKYDLIGFLTGRKTLYGLQFPFADINSDDKVDTADLIDLILYLTSPTPKSP